MPLYPPRNRAEFFQLLCGANVKEHCWLARPTIRLLYPARNSGQLLLPPQPSQKVLARVMLSNHHRTVLSCSNHYARHKTTVARDIPNIYHRTKLRCSSPCVLHKTVLDRAIYIEQMVLARYLRCFSHRTVLVLIPTSVCSLCCRRIAPPRPGLKELYHTMLKTDKE